MQMPWDTIAFDGGSTEEWGNPEGNGRAEYKAAYGSEHGGFRNDLNRREDKQRPGEAVAAQSSDTILLNGEMNGTGAQVKRLTALDPGAEDIIIAYYPFIIGKQEIWWTMFCTGRPSVACTFALTGKKTATMCRT